MSDVAAIVLIVRVGRVVAVACQAVMLLSTWCDRAETAGWTWLSLLHVRR